MPTDIPTFKARLLDERAAVLAEIAAIDVQSRKEPSPQAETAFHNARQDRSRCSDRLGDALILLDQVDEAKRLSDHLEFDQEVKTRKVI